jgi:hypothetical protein
VVSTMAINSVQVSIYKLHDEYNHDAYALYAPEQGFSDFLAGVPRNEISRFRCVPS